MSEEVVGVLREILYHAMLTELASFRAERLLGVDELPITDAWDDVALELRTPEDAFALTPARLAVAFRLHGAT